MKPLAKNVPAKSEWLFGDDLNKRINTISIQILHSLLVFAHITGMINIRVAKQVAINSTMVQKAPKLPGGALIKERRGRSRAPGSTKTRQRK